jgi:hypothetical protein
VGVVLDVVNKRDIVVAVRLGNFSLGDHFVCGSAYGKVRKISGSAGEVVEVSGIISGSLAPDDVFLVFSRGRAFRLAAYRERISDLNRIQISGPPLTDCPFQIDSPLPLDAAEPASEEVEPLPSIFVPPTDTQRPPDYLSRETWTEEATTGTQRVLNRQAKRLEAVEEPPEPEKRQSAAVKTQIEAKPVVAVILKCDSEGLFNGILDQLEELEKQLHVKIPVVHGGVGNVRSEDVDHGIAEKQFGYCPIYALNVAVSHVAKEKAENEKIRILTTNVFTEILRDVERRAKNLNSRISKNSYISDLRKVSPSTPSGL